MQLPDNQYVLYRREWDPVAGKWGKYPCNEHGQNIDAHDRTNWRSYAERSSQAHWDEAQPHLPFGVAWVLGGEEGWFFLDLDGCFDAAAGMWSSEAQAIYGSFGGALGEVSTSGNGLHVFGRCDPSQLEDRRRKWDGWLECYTAKRFVALSREGPQPIGQWQDKDWTSQLLHLVPQREALGELPEGVDPSYTGPEDDDVLISTAKRSANAAAAFGGGVTFADLWTANVDKLALKWPSESGDAFDRSSADMSLMSQLAFWTGKDMPRMDRLFRRSGLMRPKYEQREDYRRDTVQGAARLCQKVYDHPRKSTLPPPSSDADDHIEVYLTVPEMQKHFEGCVYVYDIHKVWTPRGLMKSEQFNVMYGGHIFQMMPDGTKASRKAFEAFTENTVHRFPVVETTTFRPDLEPGTIVDGAVNTYVDARGSRSTGDVSIFLDYMQRLIPNERDRTILLSWACAVVQNPGRKMLWSPVIQGVEGNGKSLLGECIAYAVGERHTHRPRSKELGSTFNGWMDQKLFILINEVHMAGRRDLMDDMKPWITDLLLPIRHMQQTETTKYCPVNLLLTTNHKDAIIKSEGDRRYAIFFSGQQSKEDLNRDFPSGFFPRLWDWLRDEGGYAAVAHYLDTMPPHPEFDPMNGCVRAPKTSSTAAAIAASGGGLEAEISELIESGRAGFQGDWVSMTALRQIDAFKRPTLPTLAKILDNMGYEKWGRGTGVVMAEGGVRPSLWRKRNAPEATYADYISAQGPSYC